MFRLSQQPAKLLNHNSRNERHGEELVLAGDIKLQVTCQARALQAFDEQLVPFLFRGRRDGDGAVQADIEGQADAEVSRRLPQLDPLTWTEKFPGNRLTIVKGMGLTNPIVLPMRELSGFVFEPIDGGLVKITFTAKGTYESTAISGELDGLQQREVEISLDPPAVDEVAEVSPQGQLAIAPAPESDLEPAIVTGIELVQDENFYNATCTIEHAIEETVGSWDHRPSLDEIAIELNAVLEQPIEFTAAAREAYEAETADA